MQRRQLLKLILPITLLSAGVVGVVLGRKLLVQTRCAALDRATLLSRLTPFSDAELAKKANGNVGMENLHRLEGLCEQGFDQQYRQLVQDDFAENRTQKVDGWILSQTEAATHLAVHQPALFSGVPPVAG